jgi:hypothetical protein
MANPIKYSTGSETLALKKGNFYIGTGDVGKGPTSSTGYYNGITPPSGGYTIYLNKETGGPSIYTVTNDTQLISLTNSIAGQSYTTANECLVYFTGQSDKVVLNRDYEGIVTDGLVLNVDAGFTPSYPTSNNTWYNVGSTINGTLTNGPTFSTDEGGSIVFDGVNDFVNFGNNFDLGTNPFTLEYFAKTTTNPNQYSKILSKGHFLQGGWNSYFGRDPNTGVYGISLQYGNNTTGWMGISGANNITLNVYYHVVYTKDSNNVMFSYINGVSADTKTESYDFTSPSYNYIVGRSGSSQEWFKGNIGVVRQYNRALSATEVLQNYNAQKGRFGL